MYGIRKFTSLAEALAQGYQVYDRTATEILVRIMTSGGWAKAVVIPQKGE